MTLLITLACAAALLSGCSSTSAPTLPSKSPSAVRIVGVVRYPSGQAVNTAWVHVGQIGGTLSNAAGDYVLELPMTADTLTVEARDGYAPGMVYAEHHWGSVRVPADKHDVTANIVLDHATPI